MKRNQISLIAGFTGAFVGLASPQAAAQGTRQPVDPTPSSGVIAASYAPTSEAPMIRGDTAAANDGWTVEPLITVGETFKGYQPAGILDGIGAFAGPGNKATVLVNHELNAGNGYAYQLKNGTMLTGARVTSIRIKRQITNGTATSTINQVGMAYDTIYDRYHQEVVDPAQVNETGNAIDGLARLCSSNGVAAGSYGFVDDIYFTGEENGKPFAPYGGTEWALDVKGRALWAVPAMGRAAWENVTPLDTGDASTVALLVGDDTAAAPLYLYVGQKDAVGDGSFLDRNGLMVGSLYAWKADNGDLTPEDFNGLNETRTGTWVELTVQDTAMAGVAGYDPQGYADVDTLQNEADALGCFSLSRPEDVATNPVDGSQAVLATTGRGGLYPSDNWGQVIVVDVDFAAMTAELVIVHDADGLAVPDSGIRSPDNLDWAGNGKVYIQEDRSTSPSSLFGGTTGIEASVWELDPITRAYTRVAEIDRSAVAPAGATDNCVGSIGCWESSGILDVTGLFNTLPNERLLIGTVQAHGIQDGPIGGNPLLDEGGQLFFMSKIGN
jgi:secreted PhoX family phosphatase